LPRKLQTLGEYILLGKVIVYRILYQNYDIILLYQLGGRNMPTIRPSSDLRNKYSEISNFCHEFSEPVYITKNGKGDLAVLSIEAYEKLIGKFELRKLLLEGMADVEAGNTYKLDDAFDKIRASI
jgi:prevent-host-death family protein